MSRTFDALRRAAVNEPEEPQVLQVPVRSPLLERDSDNTLAGETRRIAAPPKPESHIVVDSDRQNSTVREHFRYMEHQFRKLRQSTGLKRILVTSSAPREGKTVVAANLAATLACGTARVLLIDADMRGAGSGSLFGATESVGLAGVLEGRATPSEAMVYLDALKVYYIPAGRPSSSPADLVQGGQMRDLLASLEQFDWVIVDSPPIGAFADALSMATQVDGVVVVARSGLTARHELEHTLAALKDCRVAGIVLNGHDKRQKDYYRSYYSSNGKARA